jgi:hypothetical protein
MDDAPQVHVEDALPVRQRELIHLAADADAGIVEEEIETSVVAKGARDDRVNRGGIPDVEVDGDRPARRPREVPRHRPQSGGVHVREDHRVPTSAKLKRECAANPGRCARHKGDPALCQCSSPPSVPDQFC